MNDLLDDDEPKADPIEFATVMLLKETYVRLSKIAGKKGTTVPHVIAEALARFVTEEEKKP